MRVFLMYRDRDLASDPTPQPQDALTKDLELDTLINAMGRDDDYLLHVARSVLLSSLRDPDAILYRLDVLRDCIRNASVVREMYTVTLETLETRRRNWLGIFTHNPSAVLASSLSLLRLLVDRAGNLKRLADEHTLEFESEGFRRFFSMLRRDLDDEYFATVQDQLRELGFRKGALISAELTAGNVGTSYNLRKPRDGTWIGRVFTKRSPVYAFSIHPRDEAGARALAELEDRGLNFVANALGQAADHILSFFTMLKHELAFYVGCLNLYDRLAELGEPVCSPVPAAPGERKHSFRGLYDVCLALTMGRRIVGNELNAEGKDLVVITGANQGGKSTFLRSVGVAQLMMQCGMFVPAESFCANTCARIFTHFKRKEDATMKSGKLDEELRRMSDIVDCLTPESMVLFNESFAATNEREGSEIARQIVGALVERRAKILFVTHLYDFAHSLYDTQMADAVFLRAERESDGRRTFRMIEGEPLDTSYGEDLYRSIFEERAIAAEGTTTVPALPTAEEG